MGTWILAAFLLQGKPYEGELFDAHLHSNRPFDPKLLDLARDAGISRAMLMMGRGRGIQLDEKFAVRFAPLEFDSNTKKMILDDSTVTYVENQLKSGSVRGIGEIPLRHKKAAVNYPADHPIVLQILDLVARYDVPINLHVEKSYAEELDRALAHNGDAKVIWAHAGDAPPSTLRSMMKKHANLHADLSCRNPYFKRGHPVSEQSLTNDRGALKSEWKELFEDFPDRFLFGSDVGGQNQDRVKQLGEVVKYYRSVLGRLKSETAEKIGHGNAERLLKMK